MVPSKPVKKTNLALVRVTQSWVFSNPLLCASFFSFTLF